MNPIFQKILHYVNPRSWFKKEEGDANLRAMHTINKVSIFMFVICIVILAVRHYKR